MKDLLQNTDTERVIIFSTCTTEYRKEEEHYIVPTTSLMNTLFDVVWSNNTYKNGLQKILFVSHAENELNTKQALEVLNEVLTKDYRYQRLCNYIHKDSLQIELKDNINIEEYVQINFNVA